jgi:hypothetical protein
MQVMFTKRFWKAAFREQFGSHVPWPLRMIRIGLTIILIPVLIALAWVFLNLFRVISGG